MGYLCFSFLIAQLTISLFLHSRNQLRLKLVSWSPLSTPWEKGQNALLGHESTLVLSPTNKGSAPHDINTVSGPHSCARHSQRTWWPWIGKTNPKHNYCIPRQRSYPLHPISHEVACRLIENNNVERQKGVLEDAMSSNLNKPFPFGRENNDLETEMGCSRKALSSLDDIEWRIQSSHWEAYRGDHFLLGIWVFIGARR